MTVSRFWSRYQYRRRAFTLIEVLLVVALMLVLVTATGAALRDNTGPALRSTQHLLASLVGQARAMATARQTETRLIVYALSPPAGDPDKFLRMLQVFQANPSGSANWQPVGTPVYLPRGIAIVPAVIDPALVPGTAWPSDFRPTSSHVAALSATFPLGSAFSEATRILALEFSAAGDLSPPASTSVKFAAAAIRTISGRMAFTDPKKVQAVILRPNGSIAYSSAGDF